MAVVLAGAPRLGHALQCTLLLHTLSGTHCHSTHLPASNPLPNLLLCAVDNLFVFILVFNYFKTPVEYQPKVRKGRQACQPACGCRLGMCC